MTQPDRQGSAGDGPRAAGPRWRRITAGVLLGLAIVAIVLGPIMLYVRSQLLDSSGFRDRAQTTLASPTSRTSSPTP